MDTVVSAILNLFFAQIITDVYKYFLSFSNRSGSYQLEN